MKTIIFPALPFVLFSSSAHAHIGHVGEVAGHAHWIGIGILVVGAAAAAVLGRPGREEDEATAEPDENTEEGEPA